MTRRLLSCGIVLFAMTSVRADETPAKVPATNPTFEKLKKMVGTWVEADKDGNPTDKVVSVVKLTGGGSAIQETLFPGEAMEMLSVYHLDKGDVVMTHYCALGNQPRLKAEPGAKPNQIKWTYIGGTNLDPAKDMHMHGAVVTVVNDDKIIVEGEAWENGKPAPTHCGAMTLIRKQ